jgi:hypothetical protein
VPRGSRGLQPDQGETMSTTKSRPSRRVVLSAIAIALVTAPAARAADAKKKGKASKEDFYYQEEPGEKGRRCENCVNFEPTVGDKGTCSLLEGEVCKNCYCQGWTDKKTGKKASA